MPATKAQNRLAREGITVELKPKSEVVLKQTATYRRNPETLAERAIGDIMAFAELIKYKGGWDNFGECHRDLALFVSYPQRPESIKRLLFDKNEGAAHLRRLTLMPRGHLKSTINTTLYTLWRLWRNPDIRILVGTADLKLSNSFIRELRSYLENQELQDYVWNKRPHIKGNLIPELQKRSKSRNTNNYQEDDTDATDRKLIWNNVALQVNRSSKAKEPTVKATSVGTSEVGSHYDLVILDDIVTFKNVESEVKIERVNEWIADLESILDPWKVVSVGDPDMFTFDDLIGGEMVFNGTRYSLQDYYGYLLENKEELEVVVHSRNIYKNGVDSSDGFLWGERFNEHVVQRLKTRLSARRFSSQYLNTVYEKDARLFQVDKIQVIPDNQVYTQGNNVYVRLNEGQLEAVNPIICVDPAFSSGKKGDDCAIMVGAKLSTGHLVVFDAVVEQLTAAETVMHVLSFAKRYRTMRMFHEQNGVGMLLPELFKTDESRIDGKPMIVNSHYEIRTKEGKIEGVLELPIAAGKIVFTERVKENLTVWKQVRDYPGVNHDDALDCLVTLWEKTISNKRKAPKESLIDPYALRMDMRHWLKEQHKEETLLGGYNSFYA